MKPPQHSASAAIEYIRKGDPAWSDELRDELKDCDDPAEHPIILYYEGGTRYDLDAPGTVDGEQRTPRQYLREGVQPVIWRLRRLTIAEVSRCRDIGHRNGQLTAFALAVQGVTNPPPGLRLKDKERKVLRDAELEAIADVVGADVVWEVGEAALRASEAPTSAEKKPSAS